ncbi:ParB/RepB/Spo0J family partition protein [Lysinibacillus sp. NPDC097214]|uniref:ParB/RepB/Spo0J family partition protein n=1 Tax=Lysinibacillus sp. NPDC097214 TaxID=3390584 RepID=UPI003D0909D8
MQLIKLTEIQANPHQPRKHFNEQALVELSQSIKVEGVMSPIMVRPIDGKYEIVQGERRFRAAQMAGLIEIPSIVREVDEQEAFHLAVIENIQREQMTPIEEAQAFMKYVEMGFTHEQIAEKVSKSRTYVTTKLRLLNLLPEVQDWIASGRLAEGHAKVLLTIHSKLCSITDVPRLIKGEQSDFDYFQSLFTKEFKDRVKISVKDVEQYVSDMRYKLIASALLDLQWSTKLRLSLREFQQLKEAEKQGIENVELRQCNEERIACEESLIALLIKGLNFTSHTSLHVEIEKLTDDVVEEYFDAVAKEDSGHKRWEVYKASEEWCEVLRDYRENVVDFDTDYDEWRERVLKRYTDGELQLA